MLFSLFQSFGDEYEKKMSSKAKTKNYVIENLLVKTAAIFYPGIEKNWFQREKDKLRNVPAMEYTLWGKI